MTQKKYSVGIIGLWQLGEVYSACLAELGNAVVGIDPDEVVVHNLVKNTPPLPEPGLEELLRTNQAAGKLSYATDYARIEQCDVVWFTFDTPVNDDDDVDLSPIWKSVNTAIPHLKEGVVVVVSSQIPVGTSKKIQALIREKRPKLKFEYAYTPENLRLGDAVHCFLEPGRVVIGTESDAAFKVMEALFAPLSAEMVRMSPASAEMAKHALNAYLATSLSFINDIADACERSGADVLDVVRALRSDARIGQKAFLGAGLGFSGGTLGRDLKALMRFSAEHDFSVPVIEAAFVKNRSREKVLFEKLTRAVGEVRGKTIAILGLTYKPGTRTLRRSQSVGIARELSQRGAHLRLQDPAVLEEEMPNISQALFDRDPYRAAQGAQVIMLLTPWPEFKSLDFSKLYEGMVGERALLDPWNLLYDKKDELGAMGFAYVGIGR